MKKKHEPDPDGVFAFIEQYEDETRLIMEKLFHFMLRFPGVETRLSFQLPFFYKRVWICYLNPKKNGAVELCFTRAAELMDEYQLLDFRGRSLIAGLLIHKASEIPWQPLGELMREALLVDALTTKIPSKKGRK